MLIQNPVSILGELPSGLTKRRPLKVKVKEETSVTSPVDPEEHREEEDEQMDTSEENPSYGKIMLRSSIFLDKRRKVSSMSGGWSISKLVVQYCFDVFVQCWYYGILSFAKDNYLQCKSVLIGSSALGSLFPLQS